jgi:hypothetical protein
LHIDRERFLAALKLHEIRFLVPELWVFAAMTIAAQPSLAANDLRSELAEHSRHGRAGCPGRQLNDANPFKGKLAHSIYFLWSDGVLEYWFFCISQHSIIPLLHNPDWFSDHAFGA